MCSQRHQCRPVSLFVVRLTAAVLTRTQSLQPNPGYICEKGPWSVCCGNAEVGSNINDEGPRPATRTPHSPPFIYRMNLLAFSPSTPPPPVGRSLCSNRRRRSNCVSARRLHCALKVHHLYCRSSQCIFDQFSSLLSICNIWLARLFMFDPLLKSHFSRHSTPKK